MLQSVCVSAVGSKHKEVVFGQGQRQEGEESRHRGLKSEVPMGGSIPCETATADECGSWLSTSQTLIKCLWRVVYHMEGSKDGQGFEREVKTKGWGLGRKALYRQQWQLTLLRTY